jgi:hypothetical protein
MTIKIDLARLREQAMQMQTQMPELFAYLSQRDEATASMVQTIAHSIPHPDDLPQIEIPFIDAVIELSQAKKRCPICDPPDPDELWVLSPKVRAKLCHYCLNGIYLRGTGVEGLAAG